MQLPTASSTYTLGLMFIVICAVIWAGASVLIQHIYNDLSFRSPFLITYVANSLLLFYLPLWKIWVYLDIVKTAEVTAAVVSNDNEEGLSLCRATTSLTHSIDSNNVDETDNVDSIVTVGIIESRNNHTVATEKFSHNEIIRIAMVISPLWFLANCLYNYSLLLTSNSSSTIISNLAASFTLAFSWCCGLENLTAGKIVGIGLCFVGAVTVGLEDGDGVSLAKHSLVGDIVALLAAIGYGLYTTLLRHQVRDDNALSMQLLLGYIGLFNAIFLSPVLVVLVFMGLANLQHLSLPIFGYIVLNGFCDNVVSDYLWARAVVLTSPTVATIGMSITIPFAMISDYLIDQISPSSMSLFGALLVIVGFLFVNISETLQEYALSYITLKIWGDQQHNHSVAKDGYTIVNTK